MAQPVPTFYPTASRVTVGPTKDELKTVEETMEMLKKVPKFVDLFEGRHKIRDEYIKQACFDMSFDFDVVKTRGKEAITFDLAKKIVLDELYRTNQIPELKEKRVVKTDSSVEQGRMYSVEANVKTHGNCHAITSSQKHEAKKQKVKFLEKVSEEKPKPGTESLFQSGSTSGKPPLLKLDKSTGFKKDIATQSKIFKDIEKKKKTMTWDEYILTRVSKNTARWIVTNHVDSAKQKEHLKEFLEERKVGFKEQEDLTVDDESVSGEPTSQKFLEQIKVKRTPTTLSGDPINENLSKKFKSLYYKQNFADENEEVKRIVAQTENRTAMIERPSSHTETTSNAINRQKKAKQLMSHNRSEHKYVNEIVDGSKVVFLTETSDEVFLDTGNTYTVKKTEIYPEVETGPIGQTKGKKPRWKEVPQPKLDKRKMKAADETELEPVNNDDQLVALDDEGQHRKLIVQRWLKLHKIGSLWHNSDVGDIFEKLKSLDSRVRLEALGVCAQASVYRLEKVSGIAGINGDGFVIESEDQGFLPESILELVENCLSDELGYVRFGAALTLMIQDKCSEKSHEIVADHLHKVSATFEEKIIAALVLTYSGYVNSKIANVFIECMLQASEKSEMDLCISSLAKLSDSTRVIHCLIGEQLNSTSWKYRFLACKILPSLRGPPNKDITRKLVHLMWHDIDQNVRSEAAVAIGKLHLGTHVHNKLMSLYKETDRDTILDAVVRTGQLGIMTEKLLPHFLKCFKHDYISVRVAACNTASGLMLREKRILSTLEHSAQFDPSDKVKSAAIDALAHIGKSNAQLASIILWCVRWANDINVVISAARAIIKLNIRNGEVINVIQERLLSLKDQNVIDELKAVIEWLGDDPSGDLEMIRTLKEEIRKQSTKENIIKLITVLEEDDQLKTCHDKMLFKGQDGAQGVRSDGIEEVEKSQQSSKEDKSFQDLGSSLRDALNPETSISDQNKTENQGEFELDKGPDEDVEDLELVEEEADERESVVSESDYDSGEDDDDVMDNDELKLRLQDAQSNSGSLKYREEAALSGKTTSQGAPSRTTSSNGPPKPDFFRSLALSRASSNKDQQDKDTKTE